MRSHGGDYRCWLCTHSSSSSSTWLPGKAKRTKACMARRLARRFPTRKCPRSVSPQFHGCGVRRRQEWFTRQANDRHGLTGRTREWPQAAEERRMCSNQGPPAAWRTAGSCVVALQRTRFCRTSSTMQFPPKSGARLTIPTEEKKRIAFSTVRSGNVQVQCVVSSEPDLFGFTLGKRRDPIHAQIYTRPKSHDSDDSRESS